MAFKKTILVILVAGIAAGDRLDNVRPAIPLTASLAGGHSSILAAPYQSDLYKSYKGSTGAYSTGAPLVHKQHYGATSGSGAYHQNANPHHDVIQIVKQVNEPNNGDGNYQYSYETANGISASEYGVFKPGQTAEDGVQSASGSYSYTGPDNVVYTVTYTAGLEGFVPSGAHIPTPPPIPEAIQKALQYGDNRYDSHQQTHKYSSVLPTPYSAYTQPEYKVQEETNYSR